MKFETTKIDGIMIRYAAFVAKRTGAPHTNNVELGKHGRYRTNVWEYLGATGGRKAAEDDFSLHPTVKPVRLVRDAILDVAALLGPNAAGLSSTTISWLKADWWEDCERWQKRDLSARRIVYVWADGVYFQPIMEEKQCVLVLIVTPSRDISYGNALPGKGRMGLQEILGFTDGYRESTQSWRELLLDLKRRGLSHAPDLPVGDGALGFWAALREVFGSTCEQRCWFHKTGNVLNAMPKSLQAKAKGHLHDIWQAETKAEANAAFDFFVETYGVKYEKAVAKLIKDRDALLAFYDFPAEHRKHRYADIAILRCKIMTGRMSSRGQR